MIGEMSWIRGDCCSIAGTVIDASAAGDFRRCPVIAATSRDLLAEVPQVDFERPVLPAECLPIVVPPLRSPIRTPGLVRFVRHLGQAKELKLSATLRLCAQTGRERPRTPELD
jgi:hypothetical protein